MERFIQASLHDPPPSPLCYCVGFRCLGARFCAESDRRGVILGFLSCGGGIFGFRCMTPPPPFRGVGVWIGLGFSRNCLGFLLESDRGGGIFGFRLLNGLIFTYGCVTPPSPFWRCVFRSPFCGWGRGFVYLGYFFVGKCIFTRARANIEHIKGMGFSAGGEILLHMATQQPERIQSMILQGTTPYDTKEAREFRAQFTFENIPERILINLSFHCF